MGLAVFAAVGAMSHEHERAFSASLIYLGLGAVAAAAIGVLGIAWLDPIDDATVVEHVAEVALIFALFSSGLKLDRALRWREWGSVTRLLALAMPLTMAGVALFASAGHGALARRRAAARRDPPPTDPVLAGDIGVGPPGDEDEHEPNFALTAEAGGNDGLAAPLVLLGVFLAEQGGRGWIASGSSPTCSTRCRRAWRSAPGRLLGGLERQGPARPRAARPRASTATTRSPPRSCNYGVAETAGGYGFLAVFVGGLAFRRYERDHELNGARPRGRRAGREVHGARGDPAARLAAHRRRADRARAGRAGCSRSCCSWSSAR